MKIADQNDGQPAFNNYQSMEPVEAGPNSPNRCIPDRIADLRLLRFVNQDSTVLDIGCNRGFFGIALHEAVGSYTGIERTSEIDHGLSLVDHLDIDNVKLIHEPFEEWAETCEETFDVILLLAVIAYIDWPVEKLVAWISDHLNPNGYVVIEGHPAEYMGEPNKVFNPLTQALEMDMKRVMYGTVQDRTNSRTVTAFQNPRAKGMVSSVWDLPIDGMISKNYASNDYRLGNEVENHWRNETQAIARMHDSDRLINATIYVDERCIVMPDYGDPVTVDTLPEDWEFQIDEIENELHRIGIYHLDAMPKNLLVKDGVLQIVDYGLVAFDCPGTPEFWVSFKDVVAGMLT